MPGRRAKTLMPTSLKTLLWNTRTHPDPIRSRVMILLSVKAGLRAAEIAQLEWRMVLNAKRRIGGKRFSDTLPI
jgi:integrase